MRPLFWRLMTVCLIAAALAGSAVAYDSEWPPKADINTATLNPQLVPGKISVDIPSEIGDWLGHQHLVPWNSYPSSLKIGDVDGVDDGDRCVVVYVADEMIAALKISVDWEASPPTATATPIWGMLLPYAKRSVNGLNGVAPTAPHTAKDATNVAIWDFVDNDNTNEVVFVYDDDPVAGAVHENNYLYAVRQYASGNEPDSSTWDFASCPPPEILATHRSMDPPEPWGAGDEYKICEKVSICKVTDTAFPRDIYTHGHDGEYHTVCNLQNNSGTYSFNMLYQHRGSYWEDDYGTKTHEQNVADIDGDGYDEFFIDGVVDFVDASGPRAIPQVWRTGCTGASDNHPDFMYAADFDDNPANGLELFATPSTPWTHEKTSTYHSQAYPVIFDDDGDIILDYTDSLAVHGQSGVVGNWTASKTGLEVIMWPKDHIVGRMAPDVTFYAFGVAMDGTNLVCDGYEVYWNENDGGSRAAGPANGGSGIQMDWDGDYSADEMLDVIAEDLYVWRLGEKGDWLPGAAPAGMPANETIARAGWTAQYSPYAHCNWYWYNGLSDAGHNEGWENGGAGLYTHYWEKLVEEPAGSYFRLYCAQAYDMGNDYREEVVVAKDSKIEILYNQDVLDTPLMHRSPVEFEDYRRNRTEYELHRSPLRYDQMPELDYIEIVPENAGTPTEVFGVTTLQFTKEFKAIAHYTDDVTVDVTQDVTWVSDNAAAIDVGQGSQGGYGGYVWPMVPQKSARVTATLTQGTQTFDSNAVYVYCAASTDDKPAILMAGYKDSYVVGNDSNGALTIQAYVANRTNEAMFVVMLNTDGSLYEPLGLGTGLVFLWDDGLYNDDTANDGIYTGSVSQIGLRFPNVGDTLKFMAAVPQSNIYNASDPWPVYSISTGGGTLMEPTAGLFGDGGLGEAASPKVLAAGTRSAATDDWLYLEAFVEPPADPNYNMVGVFVFINNGTSTNYGVMTYAGGNRYIVNTALATSPFGTLPTGDYIIGVQAVSQHVTSGLYETSDPWPYFRTH